MSNVIVACVLRFSDKLCGSLQCDLSATSPAVVNFRTDWTNRVNWTSGGGTNYLSTSPTYPTFYSGPNRPDPGLVPDGAACDAGKVPYSTNRTRVNMLFRLLLLPHYFQGLPDCILSKSFF